MSYRLLFLCCTCSHAEKQVLPVHCTPSTSKWRIWATPKPNHNKPSHPHVLSWAIFLSQRFRGSVRAIPSQEPATLVLKRRMGVRGITQLPRPLGGRIPPEIDIRPTGFHMTGFRCPGIKRSKTRTSPAGRGLAPPGTVGIMVASMSTLPPA